MEDGIQDKVWDIRIFGHAVRIIQYTGNNVKGGQQSIAVIFGQICNNIHGRHSGVFGYL